MEYLFKGIHLIVEGYSIDSKLLNNIDFFLTIFEKGIKNSNFSSCGNLVKKFSPNGITIIILLEESHISLHTYPEKNSFFLDIFTCGDSDPNLLYQEIEDEIKILNKGEIKIDKKILKRGK